MSPPQPQWVIAKRSRVSTARRIREPTKRESSSLFLILVSPSPLTFPYSRFQCRDPCRHALLWAAPGNDCQQKENGNWKIQTSLQPSYQTSGTGWCETATQDALACYLKCLFYYAFPHNFPLYLLRHRMWVKICGMLFRWLRLSVNPAGISHLGICHGDRTVDILILNRR